MSTTPQQIGPYRIQTEIGRGGMAVVYRAVDGRSGAVVALKVLPPHLAHDERYLQRFEREGKSAARLRHPHIVRTLETGADDGYHFLAMEYVEGQTLADLLRAQRTLLPAADVVALIRQIAEGTGLRPQPGCAPSRHQDQQHHDRPRRQSPADGLRRRQTSR